MADLTDQLVDVLRERLPTDPELRHALAVALGSPGDDPQTEAPADKESKDSVDYRRSDDDGRQCGECEFFRASYDTNADTHDATCTRVSGRIHERDVCDLFSRSHGDSPDDGGGDSGDRVDRPSRPG